MGGPTCRFVSWARLSFPSLAYWLLEELFFKALTMTDTDTGPALLPGSQAGQLRATAPPDLPPGRSFPSVSSLWGGSLTHRSEAGLQWEDERSRQRGCCSWFSVFPEDLPCTWGDTGLLRYGYLWRGEGATTDTSYLTLPQTLLGSGSSSISPQVLMLGGNAEWAVQCGRQPAPRPWTGLAAVPREPTALPFSSLGATAQELAGQGERAGSQGKVGPQRLGRVPSWQGLCMHPLPQLPALGSFPLEWGERAKALRGHALAQPHSVPRSSGAARPLSVLSPSMCWEPKGPGRETGTGQSDRSHLLLSNWLLAQGLLPSLTWGQALSESCLAPLSSFPLGFGSRFGDSQQVLRGKEGRSGRS